MAVFKIRQADRNPYCCKHELAEERTIASTSRLVKYKSRLHCRDYISSKSRLKECLEYTSVEVSHSLQLLNDSGKDLRDLFRKCRYCERLIYHPFSKIPAASFRLLPSVLEK